MANEQVDYDKQYQEDLERAQALSLESLALEQFKKQKYLQQLKNTSADSISKSSRSSSVSRTSSMTESDNESIRSSWRQSKPRPRPEPNTSTQGSLIAPPPAAVRRNSSASSCSTDEPDLISFTSPPKSNQSSIFELNSSLQLQETTPNIFNVNTTPPNPNLVNGPFRFGQHSSVAALRQYNPHIQQQWNVRGFQRGTLSTFSAVHPPPFMCNNLSPVPSLSNSNSSNEQIISNLLQNKAITATAANVQPPLPPKNKKPLPPLVLPKRSKSPSSISAISTPKEQSVNNLIDLSHGEDKSSVRVSILEEFDPILSSCDSFRTTSPELEECASIGESVYEEYDPYNFIYTGSGSNSLSDPIYAAVVKSENVPMSPPPLPPRINRTTLERRKSSKNIIDDSNPCILDNITKINTHALAEDNDLQAFYRMVQHVRNQFHHRDPDTNMGLVISPMVKYKYKEGTSIKLCVHPDYDGADFNKPVSFTCDVTSSVEHVTMQLTYDLEAPQKDKYTLKVWGYNEYLVPTTLLSDYEYVHNCIKLEEDVVLILIPDGKVDRSLARTAQDDHRDKEIKFEDVVPTEPRSQVSFEHVKILLETLNSEIKKLVNAAKQLDTLGNANLMPSLQPSGVNQSVKMIAKMLGTVVTLEISEAIESLEQTCRDFGVFRNDAPEGTLSKILDQKCSVVLLSIQNLIEMYSKAFRTDFQVKQTVAESKNVNEVMDSVLIRVCALHRPSPDWKHESFLVAAQIYHGTRPIGHPVLSQPTEITDCWYPRISFNDWFDMEGVSINSLARESRLVLVLYGRTLLTPDNNDNNNAPKYTQEELGWASVQFFDYDGYMVQGGLLLSIWPKETSHIYGPAPKPGTHPNQDHPVISIEIPVSSGIIFPPVPSNLTSDVIKGDFYSLDLQTQQQLLDISVQDMLYKVPAELREVLWEKRHYLHNIPQALSKVLLAAHSWEWNCLPDLHGMLHMWKPLQPIQALELLLPTFPDMEVRKYAVKWIRGLSSDELVDYLPQLVVALRHETFEDSPLALLLLERSMRSPRVAHHLFWLLSNNLPGTMPQNCSFDFPEKDPVVISEARHYRRIMLLLRALLAICGEALRKCFISQQVLVKDLNDIAENVQKSKDSQRIHVLTNGLEVVHHNLTDNPTSLPLSPTLKVCGVQVRSCSYFNSNTLPLKINFLANDGSVVPSIYKVGDDLQQDMLTLQMVRLMDKLWLNDGLDLKMVIFSCVPTGKKRGMIEMVTKAETLRKIQVEHGLTGSFKDKPIAEWLAKHNPTELEYARAVENFTASCAGYCVVTYILGICDRHNDNIMLKTSGHLFHIDFGKFLGDAQMFGNFKRDRVPFVLTSDMAYVINGGDKPSEKFHKFVDLCCQAFNIVRNNANLFLYLFMLMASAGIKGVTPEAVSNLHKALLPQLSNPEAAANFARLIESSLKSWFTQFNFFLHNLAQLKFTGDHGEGELLSFVPKTYSMATDGRLTHVAVVSYRKRYDPDKYYVYVLRLYRENSNEPMEIHRTYKEFCELHQKLCLHFPLAKLHSLSTGLHIGRSNIKQVAERRYHEISLFIQSLFQTADEIAHSDLVYTFFHPLLRDQKNLEDSSGKSEKIENMRGRLKGQLKLSIQFSRGVFAVMVHHARGLPLVGNAQEPSTYVKVYLQPDPTKTTKRKTKVVKRNCHPSFMEMLEYRMALEIVKERTLKATVWNHDPLQENEFLGGVELELDQFDLTQEMTEWFPLVNLSR